MFYIQSIIDEFIDKNNKKKRSINVNLCSVFKMSTKRWFYTL